MNEPPPPARIQLTRRAFLSGGTLILGASTAGAPLAAAADSPPALTIGLITDLHHADKPPAGSRHYRETLGKLAEASAQFQSAGPAVVVELGDLIDAADSVETELRYLRTVDREFSKLAEDRHYVLGNHCVDTLTKSEFLGTVGQATSYYSFDRENFHLIVLDACFRSDGQPYQRRNFRWTDANIPEAELAWLEEDLRQNRKPTVVFVHQRLDVNNNHGVRNAAAVRRILESSGDVVAVFQGHSHQNDLTEIGGIPYCTLVAMIEGAGAENNGYSVLHLAADGSLRLQGFRRQQSYDWG